MSGVSSQNRFAALAKLSSSQPPTPLTSRAPSRPPSPQESRVLGAKTNSDTSPSLSSGQSLAKQFEELSVSDECLDDAGRGFQCPKVSIETLTPSSSATSSADWRARSDDSTDRSPYKNFTRSSSPPPRRRRSPVNLAPLSGQYNPLNSTFIPRHPSPLTLPPGLDLAVSNNQGHS